MPERPRRGRASSRPLAAAAGLLAACAAPRDTSADPVPLSFAPPSAWSASPPAAAPDAAAGPRLAAAAPQIEAWWLAFAAPELDAGIRAALAQHPDLRAAASQVAAARAHARAVAGAQLPELNAGLDLSRARRNLIGLPFVPGQEVIPYTTDAHSLGLQLSWELDLWSRLDSAAQAAARDSLAAQADHEAMALALSGQFARTWLILIQQSSLAGLLERRVALAEQLLHLSRRRHAAGTSPAAVLAASSARLTSLRAELERARGAASASRTQLAALSGGYPAAGGAPPAPEALPPLPEPPPAGLPAELLGRRPDLAAAELRVRAARSRAQVADAALLPRVVLTASGGTAAADLTDLLSGDFRVWSLAGNVFAPIFSGGRLRAEADAAAAAAAAAEAQYVSRALTAFAEVESTLAAEAFLRAAWQQQQDQAGIWAREAEQAQRRFAAGSGDAAAALASADLALEAEAAAQASALLLLLNRIDFHLALGGGFAAPAAP